MFFCKKNAGHSESYQKTNKAVNRGIGSSSKKRKQVVGGEGGGVDADLHPSWIASKHKKAQELSQQKFEGRRTVFTDSD